MLLVDDQKSNRKILAWILSDLGHEHEEAENGREAVEKVRKNVPDLILMDVVMPVMDGYEATREIKEMLGSQYIPVIFLTGLTDEKTLIKCLENGGDDFLSKPVDLTALRNLIKNAFRHGGRNVNVNILIDKDKLIITDNGKGIPADKLERIFEKYYTGHKEGTGIGLALCDKFMDSIGGNISCESKVGEFTKFTLEFASESE